MQNEIRETPSLPLIFSLVTGLIFFVWLFGYLGFYDFGGSHNSIYITFQLCFVLPTFLFMTYRLFNLQNRIEIKENEVLIRSIHLLPKSILIPYDCIVRAESFEFDTGDGFSPGLKIQLRDIYKIPPYKTDCLFRIKDEHFECMLSETRSTADHIADTINHSITNRC